MTDPGRDPISARLQDMDQARSTGNSNRQVVAAALSAILPGAGQLMLGQRRKGILLLVVFLALIACVWPLRLPRFYTGLVLNIMALMGLAIYASWKALVSRPSPGSPRPSKLWLLALASLVYGGVTVIFDLNLLAAGFRVRHIVSTAMEPTVVPGDHLLVDGNYYVHRTPALDDLVLVRRENFDTLKRVLAVTGDTIQGKERQIILNGKVLNEPFIQHTQPPNSYPGADSFGPITVSADKLFVMGDNRDVSLDSRFPEFGLIDVRDVVSKPLYIVWSRARERRGKNVN